MPPRFYRFFEKRGITFLSGLIWKRSHGPTVRMPRHQATLFTLALQMLFPLLTRALLLNSLEHKTSLTLSLARLLVLSRKQGFNALYLFFNLAFAESHEWIFMKIKLIFFLIATLRVVLMVNWSGTAFCTHRIARHTRSSFKLVRTQKFPYPQPRPPTCIIPETWV